MNRMFRMTVVGLVLAVAACDPGAGDEDFSSINLDGVEGKDDSQTRPTELGTLVPGVPQSQTLTPKTSGYHRYTFTAKKGDKIKLVQSSGDFRTYLRLTAPSGKKTNVSGVQDPITGESRSTVEQTLAEAGRYSVLATSYANMKTFPSARTAGAYTLALDGQTPPPPPPPGGGSCAGRTGGALIQLKIAGNELLTVWITNQQFIADAQTHLANHTQQVPMFDKLLDGGDCDPQYSWHVDPQLAGFTDFATEVCDGLPSYIEHNKSEWLNKVHNYCPWQAEVVAVAVDGR